MARLKAFDEVAALEKALQLFWQKGFAATSMQDLVDAMQISRSSLYTTYGDKEAIYLKAIKAYKSQTSEVFKEHIRVSSEPVQMIKEMVTAALLKADEGPCSGCFMVHAMCEDPQLIPGLHDLTSQNAQEVISAFTDAFLADGQNDLESAQRKAQSIFSLHSGTILLLNQGISKESAVESFKMAFDAIADVN